MKTITMTLAVTAFFIISARGQGFLNLDFESAQNLPGNPGNGVLVSASNALPDWTAYNGPNALPYIYFVSNSLGNVSGAVELEGGSLALSGDFSVGLYDGGAISQTGLVPEDTQSLQFESYGISVATGFVVTLGGQFLSYSALSEGPGYTVYGANIPADMDDQMEALTFSVQDPRGTLLDNIEFSPVSVPEPSACALIGLGAILLGLRRRSRASRQIGEAG